MTPSSLAKDYGAKSLTEIHRQSGLSLDRLRFMANNKPNAFKYLVWGIVYETNIKTYLHQRINS